MMIMINIINIINIMMTNMIIIIINIIISFMHGKGKAVPFRPGVAQTVPGS